MNKARILVAAVLGLLLAAGVVATVLISHSNTDRSAPALPVGKPTSVPWPSTISGSTTTVEIVVARITVADDPALGNGRKVADVRIFFRNVSSKPVDVRGYLSAISVYGDGGAKASPVHDDLGLCSPNSGSTVLGADNADTPFLDCALYRLPPGTRGVDRVVFTKNVEGRTTTVTWTPA